MWSACLAPELLVEVEPMNQSKQTEKDALVRKRTAIICSLVFLVFSFICVAIPLFYLLARKTENEIAVLNHASEDISQGEVHVFGQTYRFQRLAVNETARIVSSANGEGGYFVNVKFQSGGTLSSEELGYLTAGMISSDLVEIQDDKITIVESRITGRWRDL